MKKNPSIYIVFLLFSFSPFSIFHCAAQQEIIYSCDFEEWTYGMPDGWEITSPASIVSVYPAPAFSGWYSCMVENDRGGSFINMTSTETFPIRLGKKYVLSFAINMLRGNSNVEISIVNPENSEVGYYLQKTVLISFNNWYQYEVEFLTFELSGDSLITGNALSINLMGTDGIVESLIDNIKLVETDYTNSFNCLDVNNIKAYIDPLLLFLNEGYPKYFEVPKNSKKTTIFASNLWLGGLDDQNSLHVAAQRFCQQGKDFFLGPVTTDYEVIYGNKVVSDAFREKYHRTWKVTKDEVEYHKTHYTDPSYEMPWGIANWPAHGRTEYGESNRLAPFKDVSGNGWYTPWLGDYPEIRGDQTIYFIINDAMGEHTESGGAILGVEILGMAYAYNYPDSILQNTIFLSYLVRNKSTNNYNDFYFGFWSDFEIGYAKDDYVGCDEFLNLAFGYNATPMDGNGEADAYGAHPPAQGTMFLNQKMSAFTYNTNNYPKANEDPKDDFEYYNMLQGKWKDGTPMTYWGNGYNLGSTDYTKYAYNGDLLTGKGWTELTPNGAGSYPNPPDDRRGMMSTGPFTLHAGKSMCVDIALPFARDYQGNNISSVALLKQRAQAIHQFYYNQNFENNCSNIIGVTENTIYNDKLLFYPNPSNGQFTVTCEFVIESVELYDMLGKKVFADTPKVQTIQISTKLPKGLYIYRVVLQDNSMRSGKIMVH